MERGGILSLGAAAAFFCGMAMQQAFKTTFWQTAVLAAPWVVMAIVLFLNCRCGDRAKTGRPPS